MWASVAAGCGWIGAVSELESLSRDELLVLARGQAATIARQDAQISSMAVRLDELMARFEETAGRLVKLEHLLSRNSSNSSWPSSKDGGPGGAPPAPKKRAKPSGRAKGKQPGAPGTALRWCEPDELDAREDRFPQGACQCGTDLAEARDLGVVDRYQQWEIPLVTVTVTQYDQHAVACACGTVATAARPGGAGHGRAEYGPQLRAFAVYLMTVHFVPVARCREILTSLTGAEPSIGFVHGLLARAAVVLATADRVIRTLITLAVAVCADETPLKVGPASPPEGKTEAKGYLLVACTELYTHFLLGDRSLATFREFVFTDLSPDAVVVHDRYQNYDSAQLGTLAHQLCLAHVLRDLATAVELHPAQAWPTQLVAEIRELIHRANQARARGRRALPEQVRDLGVRGLRSAVAMGLAATTEPDDRPGARKIRLLREALREREADFLRFTTDLRIPPTSNQAERDLRPSKIQEKISGRLTHLGRAKDRYLVRGVLSTAMKHAVNPMTVLRDAFTGTTWLPPAATALP
jgi:transposase